jgi:transposase InsO family protein
VEECPRHGRAPTTSQYTDADCAAFVEKWNLLHTFAPVGCPTGNAVAERVIRTMKEEVVWLRHWDSADELREALHDWQVRYNTPRPMRPWAGRHRPSTEPRSSVLGVDVAA